MTAVDPEREAEEAAGFRPWKARARNYGLGTSRSDPDADRRRSGPRRRKGEEDNRARRDPGPEGASETKGQDMMQPPKTRHKFADDAFALGVGVVVATNAYQGERPWFSVGILVLCAFSLWANHSTSKLAAIMHSKRIGAALILLLLAAFCVWMFCVGQTISGDALPAVVARSVELILLLGSVGYGAYRLWSRPDL